MDVDFSVLVVEPDRSRLEQAQRLIEALFLESGTTGQIHTANTFDEALTVIGHEFVNAALISALVSENSSTKRSATAGLKKLLTSIDASAPCVKKIVLLAASHRDLLDEVIEWHRPEKSLVDGFVRLREADPPVKAITKQLTTWRDEQIQISSLDDLADELLEKDEAFREAGNDRMRLGDRNNTAAMRAEISHILTSMFGHALPSLPGGANQARLEFKARGRGLSPSVAVEVVPILGLNAEGEPVRGNHSWVKIGAKHAIRREVERYESMVKHGVALSARVELLDFAYGDRLAAICYSVAGGGQKSAPSLDAVVGLAIDGSRVRGWGAKEARSALGAIDAIFGSADNSWYRVSGAPSSIKRYYDSEISVGPSDLLSRSRDRVRSLATQYGLHLDEDRGVLRLGRHEARIATDTTLAVAALDRPMPTCLVHGDLHGGNIMVGESPTGDLQYSLIDFARSTFGPRLSDPALLAGSFRLWDAKACPRHAARVGNAAIQWAGGRIAAEQQILESARRMRMGWAVLDEKLRDGLPAAFGDSGPVHQWELVSAYFMHSQRLLTLPLPDLEALRVIAWASALVEWLESPAKQERT